MDVMRFYQTLYMKIYHLVRVIEDLVLDSQLLVLVCNFYLNFEIDLFVGFSGPVVEHGLSWQVIGLDSYIEQN